jgi:transcription antitermination factor NusG
LTTDKIGLQSVRSGQTGHSSTFLPCASVPGLPWLCAYTKPGKELQTELKLWKEGAAAWLPLTVTIWKNQQKRISPIFPRYLFFQMSGERPRWGYTIHTEGGEEIATAMKSAAGRPIEVPQAVIDILLAQCAPNGVIYPPEPRETRRGDAVKIENGPFQGFSGIVQRTTRERLFVLMTIFGRSSEVPFLRKQVGLIA